MKWSAIFVLCFLVACGDDATSGRDASLAGDGGALLDAASGRDGAAADAVVSNADAASPDAGASDSGVSVDGDASADGAVGASCASDLDCSPAQCGPNGRCGVWRFTVI